MNNDNFIADKINNEIEQYTITITNNIINNIINGFVDDKNCDLNIICLLQHCFDNFIIYNKKEFNNIVYIYNYIINEQ